MKIKIDVFDQQLIASVENITTGGKEYIYGEKEINSVLDTMYTMEEKSFPELLMDGKITVTKKTWSKFTLVDNKYIGRKPMEEKKERVVESKKEKSVERSADVRPGADAEVHDDVTYDIEEEERRIKEKIDKEKEEKKLTPEEKKERRRKRIRNLKVAGVVVAVLAGGYVLCKCGKNAIDTANVRKDDDNKKTTTSDTVDGYNTTYNLPSDEEIIVDNQYASDNYVDPGYSYSYEEPVNTGRYATYGSAIDYDDMQTQIQSVNDACFSYQTVDFQNFVIQSDVDAMTAICEMRNRVLMGNCTPEAFLNNVTNYLFEGGTVFDGKVIKTYDALTPFSQYIVTVASQSILERCPNYDHTTPYNYYNYDILCSSFDCLVDFSYRTLSNADGRTY